MLPRATFSLIGRWHFGVFGGGHRLGPVQISTTNADLCQADTCVLYECIKTIQCYTMTLRHKQTVKPGIPKVKVS